MLCLFDFCVYYFLFFDNVFHLYFFSLSIFCYDSIFCSLVLFMIFFFPISIFIFNKIQNLFCCSCGFLGSKYLLFRVVLTKFNIISFIKFYYHSSIICPFTPLIFSFVLLANNFFIFSYFDSVSPILISVLFYLVFPILQTAFCHN